MKLSLPWRRNFRHKKCTSHLALPDDVLDIRCRCPKKTYRVSMGSTLTRFGIFVKTYKCCCNSTILSSRSYDIARTVYLLNSLWPSDAIWRQGSGSTLAQVMAWCLTAPSHYMNQCLLIICGVLHHSPEVSSTGNAYESNHYNAFEN